MDWRSDEGKEGWGEAKCVNFGPQGVAIPVAPNTVITVNKYILTMHASEDLARGFAHGEKQHRPPPGPDEISFDEAMVPDLVKKYWDILGNAAKKLGGYVRSEDAGAQKNGRQLTKLHVGDAYANLIFPTKYEDWGT